ncbi:hypothetical protein [Piscirickettsia litoralis]|uniref:Uncharacterized protein n=1 Tax=Piscirickettsia litoralis TaxID=1891921 RepID=A0ABX3A4Y5_9GAMM|nr:hypothetical protein [Piscirickettsia litoralis]ODN42470.1 hypothetical protein BGC07_05430 [Piscirickettsia litoralis]
MAKTEEKVCDKAVDTLEKLSDREQRALLDFLDVKSTVDFAEKSPLIIKRAKQMSTLFHDRAQMGDQADQSPSPTTPQHD